MCFIVFCTEFAALRKQYKYLASVVDARVTAAHLYQEDALTLKDLQSIQSLKDRPVAAAEKLLNIIMEQPDAVYLCFLDALKQTNQQRIYKKLIEDGYKGEYISIPIVIRLVSITFVNDDNSIVYVGNYRNRNVVGDVTVSNLAKKLRHYRELTQVARLSQRDRAAGWISFDQK